MQPAATTTTHRKPPTRARCLHRFWAATCVLSLLGSSWAGVLPLTFIKSNDVVGPTSGSDETFALALEYHPNGTWLLSPTSPPPSSSSSPSSPADATAMAQNVLLLKSVLGAIKLAGPLMPAPPPDGTASPSTRLTFKIYGEGVEHKFPPFLERVIQRIQSYFSVYKYTDTSAARPVRQQQPQQDETTTPQVEGTTLAVAAAPEGSGDYPEFISIGENDGFITVGED